MITISSYIKAVLGRKKLTFYFDKNEIFNYDIVITHACFNLLVAGGAFYTMGRKEFEFRIINRVCVY